MSKIKIVSNTYEKELTYYIKDSRSNEWKMITYKNSPNSRLFSKELVGVDFAEIADKVFGILYKEFRESPEKKLQIEFEGTEKEYEKALSVVNKKYVDKIEFLQGQKYLFNVEEVEAKLKVCIETLCDANLEKIDVSISEYITELNLLMNNQEYSKFCVVNEMRIKIKQLISKMRVRFSEVDKEKDEISSELKQINEWKKESNVYFRNEKVRAIPHN